MLRSAYICTGACWLLASCGAETPQDDTKTASTSTQAVTLALSPLELTAKAALDKEVEQKAAIAALEKRVKPAMDAYLLDPFSARYRQLRAGKSGAICGQVNAKNRLGAYVGFKDFVLGRDGEALYVSKYSDGVKSEIYTSFADAYVNACASKAEQQRHAAAVNVDEDYHYPDYVTDAAEAAADGAEAGEAEAEPLEDPFEND